MFSYPFYELMKKNTPEFEELAAFQAGGGQISTRRGESDRIAKPLRGEFVSGNYFQTFGVGAFAGRTIQPADDQENTAPVAMLSYRAWQQQYGADPKVIGSTFILNGHPFTIIGITPPGFFGDTLRSDPPDLFYPILKQPVFAGPNSFLHHFQAWLRVVGRLKPGATADALPARMTTLIRQWLMNGADFPADWMSGIKAGLPKQFVKVVPAGNGIGLMKEDYGNNLRILLAVCALVLLIACANIANLLLARGTARSAQTSVRLALGASRTRLIRQSLTESLVLSVFGGLAGLIIAYLGVKLLVALTFHSAKYVPIDATPSLPVLGFAFALSLLTGALFGTAPAWLATHADPAETLRGANRSTHDRSSFSQKILVILQATLSVVLLAGAGLLTRSLEKMQHQELGYEVDHRALISLIGPFNTYSPPRLDALYRELQDRLARIPGVESAALALYAPLQDNWGEMIIREGHGMPNMNEEVGSSWDHVTPSYLDTMGQHIVRGRGITEQDTAATQNVAVVNEAFAKRFFKPGENPIGQRFGLDLPQYGATYQIVGVVNNAKYMWGNLHGTEEMEPIFFAPLAQHVKYDNAMMQNIDDSTHYIEGAVLKLRGSMDGLEPQVRQALSEVDPNITLLNIEPMQQHIDANFDSQRAMAQMTGLFGILALILAAVGLYGVTAYTVERRTGEIGVRMALGADRGNIVKLVLRGAFLQILIGLTLGIPISILCGHLIAAQLYEVKSWDPLVLSGSIVALGICALIASILPAQRAASIDPVKALRTE
jgi:predicted permease